MRLTCAFFVSLGSAALLAQGPSVPVAVDLAAAIAAANAATPLAPYPLQGPSSPVTRNAPLDPDAAKTLDPNKILTFGAVYTPFLRTAILARHVIRSGRPFGAPDVPPALQDGLTYVAALPWQRADVTGPERLVDASYVILTPPGSTDRAQTVQPVWVKPNTDVLRQALGADVPERAMLAAFAPTEIRAGREFVIVYAGPVYAQRVTIRADDVAAWR